MKHISKMSNREKYHLAYTHYLTTNSSSISIGQYKRQIMPPGNVENVLFMFKLAQFY